MTLQEIEGLLDTIHNFSREDFPGSHILALTEEDKAARDFLRSEMEKRNLKVYVDVIGNMIGVREGSEELPAVAVGSHLDSVVSGGKFDGPAGVIAGLAVIDYLNDQGLSTRHPVAVINFTNEEGTRFTPDMMGSYVFNGNADLEEIYASKALEDPSISVKAALENIGYLGDMQVGEFPLKAFIELHIEQGKILEEKGLDLGIVEAVQGIFWTAYEFHGEANHAGTTPMTYRKDAGKAAFKLAAYSQELASNVGVPQVITCGHLQLTPNIPNIIPGRAYMVLDNRHPNAQVLQDTQDRLDFFARTLASEEGLKLEITPKVRVNPLTFSRQVIDTLGQAAKDQGVSHMHMISGAGHDAQLVGMTYPAAMVFVPSRRGISHNPEEFTESRHIQQAIEVITQAVVELAT
ncbi:MAG: M20 family metallo-hydrolase [Bacteroidota bacterium]